MFNDFEKINVKICCIKSNNEAHKAFKYGAKSIGLVSKMPSGPGIISDRLIKQIAESSPTSLKTILLTSDTDPYKIINQYKKVSTFVGYPKVVWLQGNEGGFSDNIGFPTWDDYVRSDLQELSFLWEDQILWKFMNDDYMGPDDDSVKSYYRALLD